MREALLKNNLEFSIKKCFSNFNLKLIKFIHSNMAKVTTLTILVILMIWTTSARNDYRDYNMAAFEAQNKARTNPKYYADRAKDQLENKFVYDRSQKPTSSICLEEDFVPKSNKCYTVNLSYKNIKNRMNWEIIF